MPFASRSPWCTLRWIRGENSPLTHTSSVALQLSHLQTYSAFALSLTCQDVVLCLHNSLRCNDFHFSLIFILKLSGRVVRFWSTFHSPFLVWLCCTLHCEQCSLNTPFFSFGTKEIIVFVLTFTSHCLMVKGRTETTFNLPALLTYSMYSQHSLSSSLQFKI